MQMGPPKTKPRARSSDPEHEDFSGIRPYLPKDRPDVNMLLGLSSMEGLATANKQVYMHPLVLTLWAAISLTLDYFIGWWPIPELWWSFAALAVGFGASSIPFLVIVELINRSFFETLMRKTIGKEDLADIQAYYANAEKHPSVCVVLSHHGDAIGCCAVDAEHAGEELDIVIEAVKSKDRPFDLAMVSEWISRAKGKKVEGTAEQNKLASEKESVAEVVDQTQKVVKGREGLRSRKTVAPAKGTEGKIALSTNSNTAELRHLHVDVPYRLKGVGTDLLNDALSRVMASGSTIDNVIVEEKFWTTSGGRSFLRKRGFKPVTRDEAREKGWRELPSSRVMGVRYDGQWLRLRREDWKGPVGNKQ